MEQNVYDDCWNLLKRFGSAVDEDLSQLATFERFSQCWLELQMQHIYSAQTNYIEVIETTLAALHVAKRVACSRRTNGESFQATRAQRIGSIFLLYALYNKQPTKHFVKIEVSQSTWTSLSSYIEELRRMGGELKDTQQVSHLFWKLVQQDAFRFTALDYCHALDALAAYDSLESFADARKHRNINATLLKQQLKPRGGNISEELHGLAELAANCKPLCQLETAYNKQMEMHRSSFAATQIFSTLQETLCEINDLLTDVELPTTSSESNDQLEVRKRIRQKAMFRNAQVKISTKEDEESEQSEQSEQSSDSHERRMSSATVFERKLPDEVLRDLES